MTFFNRAFQNLLAKTVAALIAFLATMLLPTLIGLDHFGIYAYIIVCLGVVIPITSFGFGAGTIYLLSAKIFDVRQTTMTQLVLSSVFGILNVCLLLVMFQFGWLGSAFQTMHLSEWFFFLSGCWLQTVSFFIGRSLFGLSAFSSLNIIDLTASALQPFLLVGCMMVFGGSDPFYIFCAQWIFSMVLFFMHVFILFQFPFEWRLNKSYVTTAMNYGLKSWLGDMALRANLRLDQMILGAVSTNVYMGIYNIAVKLTELVWFFPDAVGPVLFNKLAGAHSAEQRLGWLARIHRVTFIICVFTSVIWVFLVKFVIIPNIFNDHTEVLFYAFVILLPGTLILVSSKILTKLYSSSGKVLWTSYISLVGSLISILLCFWLIPEYAVTGAALASTVSYISMSSAAWWILSKKYEVQWFDFIRPRSEDFKWLIMQFKSFNLSK